MRLRRLAQVSAGLSLACLGGYVWLIASRFGAFTTALQWLSPLWFLSQLANTVYAVGYTFALAAAMLLLFRLATQRPRAWSITLLVVTVALAFAHDSEWFDMLVLYIWQPELVPATALSVAADTTIHSISSALLALAVLALSLLDARIDVRSAARAAMEGDPTLEMHVENVGTEAGA